MSFEPLGVKPELVQGLAKAGILTPTDIQTSVIPEMLLGKDIIAESVTGSGKTLAYLLPLFMAIQTDQRDNQAIILTPTHELASQIHSEIKKLAQNSQSNITSALIIGETNIHRQVEALKAKPHILIGSPGRIRELIGMRKIKAHTVKTIVLDEVDRMTKAPFSEDIAAIIKATQRDRRLFACSASISAGTEALLQDWMKSPSIFKLSQNPINPNIEHYFILVDPRDKIEMVRKIARAVEPDQLLVFLNKNQHIQDMENRLKHHHVEVLSLYGAGERQERKDAMAQFRSGKIKVLVASDLGARGLDIPTLKVVVCVDLPKDPEEYLHRVGRTARHQGKGLAISLLSKNELSFLPKLDKAFGITPTEAFLRDGALHLKHRRS